MLLKLISGEESVGEERAGSEDFNRIVSWEQTKAIYKALNQCCVLRCRKDVVQGDHYSDGGGGAGSA